MVLSVMLASHTFGQGGEVTTGGGDVGSKATYLHNCFAVLDFLASCFRCPHFLLGSLPCLIAIIDFAEYRSKRDRVAVQELVLGLQIKKINSDN